MSTFRGSAVSFADSQIVNYLTRDFRTLLVERNAYLTLAHSDRAYVMKGGAIAVAGSATELRADPRVQNIYLGGAASEDAWKSSEPSRAS